MGKGWTLEILWRTVVRRSTWPTNREPMPNANKNRLLCHYRGPVPPNPSSSRSLRIATLITRGKPGCYARIGIIKRLLSRILPLFISCGRKGDIERKGRELSFATWRQAFNWKADLEKGRSESIIMQLLDWTQSILIRDDNSYRYCT